MDFADRDQCFADRADRRGSCFYWFSFLIFRFVMRRDVGGIGVADVLLVVLIADTRRTR
jgi:uncharacterized membrane protein YcaP (DUF421 family)